MEPPEDETVELPRELRFLKTLVTVLTAVMILGLITIVVLLVIRLNGDARPILVHPELFALPAGAETLGYNLVGNSVVILTDDGMIRVFDATSRALLQELPIRP